ncbi:pyridoxal phosphate-dependent aminotransferase [bacterium]|nr:pyridoxal phosphate-dependent aminotransferase [bacterium]
MLQSKLPKVGTTIFTVMSQLALKHQAVNLGQGFPDFEGPQPLRDALFKHVSEGKNQYAPMIGVAALREQIAMKTEAIYGRKTNPDSEVSVVSGASEALYVAIAAIVHPGDEVIVLDPCYDAYDPAIQMAGGKAVHVALQAPAFSPDWDLIRAAVTAKTRMIMINSPHNPTGAMLTRADMLALSELIAGRDIYVLSDEVYEHITFDGAAHESVLRYPALAERSFAVSSFGKTYHITGWKIGYCVAPPALTAEFRKIHQYLTFSTFTAAQWALADYLALDPEHHIKLPQFYQEKRDDFQALLKPSRFQLLPVQGAYFQLADYSQISDLPELEFCQWLVQEKGVAAIPMSAFYESPPKARLVRFCFAKNAVTLAAAAERLCAI